MRILSTIAACVVSIAMLAGCANQSQSASALPSAASGVSGAALGVPMMQFGPRHKFTEMELLKLQAAGKIPGPSSVAVMKQILKRIQTKGHLHLKAQPNAGTVSVWAADTYDNFIVGLKKNLTKTVAAIPTYNNHCPLPTQIKVDHNQNIWAGCQGDEYNFPNGGVAEWNSAGTGIASYQVGCPNGWAGCQDEFSSLGTYASAADATHVFASVVNATGINCGEGCVESSGAGVEWWPAGQPSATPTFDQLPQSDPVLFVEYMDEDNAGNLWVTFFGCDPSCGYGLGEFKNPTSPSWTFTIVEDMGTYLAPGGVYVSNAGSVLNVTDPFARLTYQYSLPLAVGGSPMNVLGPTPVNFLDFGYPVSGGFDQSGAKLILGDSEGWLDRGQVASNHWKAKANIDIQEPQGAAFTPSDK